MNKLKIILLMLLMPCLANAQKTITTDKFHWSINRGVKVVEFWVIWNKENQVDFLGELTNCEAYRYPIVSSTEIMEEYNVTAAPTILIFKDGELKARFEPNIMMQISESKEEVQAAINSIANENRRRNQPLTDSDRMFRY